jgi:hypothetical protein
LLTKADHRSIASGGLFLASDSVVDPRIGALGPALLALEDGTVFDGVAFGAPVAGGGDLVANTSYTGYQEICTDPSYAGQAVLMTYPLIGNYGRLLDDDQSRRPWLSGLIVGQATAAVLEPARQLVQMLRAAACPHHRARRHGRGDGRRGGRTRPALGGPGLRQPGIGRGTVRSRTGGWTRSGGGRLRAQGEHLSATGRARRTGARPAAHD